MATAPRPGIRERLKDLLAQRILILDGAMGTMIQAFGLDEAGFRAAPFRNHIKDLKGCNDILSLTQLQVIEALHRQYLEAGVDIIETNTFNATSFGLAEYDLADHVFDINKAAAEVARRAGAPPGSLVLDVGSNDGSLLAAFREMGYRVLGVDPAVEIAERATAAGVETVPAYFTAALAQDIRQRHGQAAVVTANNVFAHSDQLPEMADGVRSLLTAGGVFVFEVSYLLDIVQKMLFDTVYHEHLCFHSVRSLDRFFRRHHLELIDVERIPTKGGSLRGTVQLAGGPRPVSPAVARMIEWEKILRLHSLDTFRDFARRIEAARQEFTALLDRLRDRDMRLAGYGASPTVTTLLHHFELAERLEYLVDDNPVKQHTYSPGHHLPVYPSEALYSRGADAVVILAWNYAQPIMARHQTFREQGGRFLVPLPSLQVF